LDPHLMKMVCGHYFHELCVLKLVKHMQGEKRCPLCRTSIQKVLICDHCQQSIKMDGIKARGGTLKCGHIICWECLIEKVSYYVTDNFEVTIRPAIWKRHKITCPVCRDATIHENQSSA